MLQQPLPAEITGLNPQQTAQQIREFRAALGSDLIILGHHYQRDEIIEWADFRGDSLKLSQVAGEHPEAKYIIFCGVHFMAETADILTTPEQAVILPNLTAGCSMADMASIRQVESAWDDLQQEGLDDGVIPVTYVNSTAAIKAFVGRHGGACCTSSNARQVIEWAFKEGKKLFFFPDQHLGRNTSANLGLDPVKDMLLWDPQLPLGGHSVEDVRNARVLLWKGHCSVHARFTVEQIKQARAEHPGVQIVVHPECSLDVVKAADLNGSTDFIIRTLTSAPEGTVWGVGTEINLVSRLAKEMPNKTIFCLDPVVCPCSTMYRIHPHYLLWVMKNLVEGYVVNRITVQADMAASANLALDRMLRLS